MRIAVMAAGAVGGYFGARVAAAGHDVAFIARGAHRNAIRRNGLAIESTLGDLHLKKVNVTDDPNSCTVALPKSANRQRATMQTSQRLDATHGGELFPVNESRGLGLARCAPIVSSSGRVRLHVVLPAPNSGKTRGGGDGGRKARARVVDA
jgi:hypothetical protein